MNTKTSILLLLAATTVITLLVAGMHVSGSPSPRVEAASGPPAATPTASPDGAKSEQKQEEPRIPGDSRYLVDSFRKKLLAQGNVPTFFDNMVQAALEVQGDRTAGPAVRQEAARVCKLFGQLLESKHERFCSFNDRMNDFCPLTGAKTTLPSLAITLSQGTHSVVKWKQHDVFKTTFDLALYWMIMEEIKPKVIVELGSGPGGSAIWFADMASALGFKTHVYSYDIIKPDISYPNVTFVQYDLEQISNTNPLPFKDRFVGTKLVSEDAHVNVKNVLLGMDSFLSAGDYLIVEDSSVKQGEIAQFLDSAHNTYRLDRYYLDFFGKNGCSCIDSIFKVF